MKFETILRKAHVPDENTVAHLGFPVCVCKQKEVVTVYTESFSGSFDISLAHCIA